MSFISNFPPDGATIARLAAASTAISAKTQFLEQVKVNSTSQLINGIFKTLQKLLKCFCRITTFAFVNELLSCRVFPTILCFVFKRFRIRRQTITWFISVVIPQTVCCFSVVFTVFK